MFLSRKLLLIVLSILWTSWPIESVRISQLFQHQRSRRTRTSSVKNIKSEHIQLQNKIMKIKMIKIKKVRVFNHKSTVQLLMLIRAMLVANCLVE